MMLEPVSAESDVEIFEGTRPKRRKNGDGRDVHSGEEARSSVKRPRHSISGPEIRDPSGSEFPLLPHHLIIYEFVDWCP